MAGRAGAIVVGVLAGVCLLLGVAASGQAAAAGERAGSSVVNGKKAPIAEFPWLVYVHYKGPLEEFACTGTVVAPRVVLTAGHCAVAESGRVLSPGNYHVTWGTAKLKKNGRGRTTDASRVLLHPGYNPNNYRHDAALLILAAPVGAPSIPIATAADGDLYASGTEITIAGWGLTDGDALTAPAAFRTGTTVIGAHSFCKRKTYPYPIPFDPASQLCSNDRPRHRFGACNGDSGGPGIAHRADGSPVQVGIVSTGGPFCRLAFPEVQTRVDRINPWISGWIAAVETGAEPPPVTPPRLYRLPRIGFVEARLFTFLVLLNDFRFHYLMGQGGRPHCERIDREAIKCGVFWRLRNRVYGGNVSVRYVLPREGSLVRFQYRIRRVGADCWERKGSLKRCPGRTFRR